MEKLIEKAQVVVSNLVEDSKVIVIILSTGGLLFEEYVVRRDKTGLILKKREPHTRPTVVCYSGIEDVNIVSEHAPNPSAMTRSSQLTVGV